MELGNAIFGHSRGRVGIQRGKGYEEQLERLFEAILIERDTGWRDYGVDFSNEVFETHPYWWGDCTCGYEERWEPKEAAWEVENPHADNCYQTVLRVRTAQYDRESGYAEIDRAAFGGDHSIMSGFDMDAEPLVDEGQVIGQSFSGTPRRDAAMEAWRQASKKRDAFLNGLYSELCQRFKRSRRLGCAVHCTCGRDTRWQAFSATDDHDPACLLVRPNFWHKPSDYELRWYKYPLRDSYASRKLSLPAFSAVIDACIASVKGEAR